MPYQLRLAGAALFAALSLLVPAAAHATTYTVNPQADAYTSSASPSTNYGKATTLATKIASLKPYLRFAVPTLDGRVTSAKLRLYATSNGSAGLSIRPTADNTWNETAITASNAPSYGAPVADSSGFSSGQWATLDATNLVSGSGLISFVVSTGSSTTINLASREGGSATAPQLVIQTTPNSTPPPTPSAPSNVSPPTVSGNPVVGSPVSGTNGTWNGSPTSYSYQWRRCDASGCTAIGGAASSSYTPVAGDVGRTLQIVVTAANSAGSASATSAASSAVADASSPNPPPGPQAAVYVDPMGSDANACTSIAPCKTFDRAYHVAKPGAVVQVAGGTYAAQSFSADSTKSSATQQVSFQPAAGASVTVNGGIKLAAGHVGLSGMTVTNSSGDCITVQPALTDIAITGNTIKQCGSDGIGFARTTSQAYTSNVTISGNQISSVGLSDRYANNLTIFANYLTADRNDLTGTPNDAIDMWGDHLTFSKNRIHDISNTLGNHDDAFQTWTGLNDGAEGKPVTNLLIDSNIVENIGGGNSHCLMSEGPGHSTWVIRNNVFRGVGDQCMIFGKDGNGSQGIQGIQVYNNTFVSAGGNNTIEFNLTSTGTVADNIFYNCAGYGGWGPFWVASTASVRHDYNLSGGSSPAQVGEAHSVSGNPMLVNPSGGDYHLSAGSPAINRGDNGALISPTRTSDVYGKPNVGIADIGAAEYQG